MTLSANIFRRAAGLPITRTPVIRRSNRAIRLRAAADLIADIPAPPTPGSYPQTRTVLDAHATLVCDRMSGRTDKPIGGAPITRAFRDRAARRSRPRPSTRWPTRCRW